MKYTLTISTDSAAELVKLLTGVSSVSVLTAATTSDDDDGPANVAAPAVDSRGIPWNEEFHAKNKNTSADGTWKKKKGFDPVGLQAYEAQFSGGSGMPSQAQFNPIHNVAAPVTQIVPQQFTPPAVAPVQTFAPPVNEVPAAAPVQQFTPAQQFTPPAAASVQVNDFNGLMMELSKRMVLRNPDGTAFISAEYLSGVAQAYGVNSITDLATRPDLVPHIVAHLARDGKLS